MTDPGAARDAEIHEDHSSDVLTAFEGDVPSGTRTPSALVHRIRHVGPAIIAFFVILLLWEAVTRLFDIKSFILPKPTEILAKFVSDAAVIWAAGLNTLYEALGGLIIGTVLGVVVALATVRWVRVREGLMPFAIAANAVPIIALAPIANAMFGLTSPVSKMAVVAVVVFFPVMINTARGLIEVDVAELELLRSYAATPREVMRRIRIPHALPYFFSALKVSSALSLIAAIVAEYFGGPQDVLGQYILNRAFQLLYPQAWAAILVASILGIGFYVSILIVERLVMPWHIAFRSADDA